jgi:hypothetical protein
MLGKSLVHMSGNWQWGYWLQCFDFHTPVDWMDLLSMEVSSQQCKKEIAETEILDMEVLLSICSLAIKCHRARFNGQKTKPTS